jgi:hypothetical protein
MALKLNKEVLEHCWDFIRVCHPLKSWNLPHAEDMNFKVIRSTEYRGWYRQEGDGSHTIAISERCIGHISSLVEVMMHEAVHCHQSQNGMETPGTQHNRAWHLDAKKVCKAMGFDPKLF